MPVGEAKEVQVSAKRTDDKAGMGAGASSARREMLQILRSEEDEAWEALEFCDILVCVCSWNYDRRA